MEEKKIAQISVTWRGRQLCVDADPSCTVKEFGQLLQNLTRVKPETLKLIVPQSTNKGSKLITPFSDAHSSLKLEEAAINEGKPIRMMGVFDDEIEEVSDNGKRPDLRIIGFDEEEQRLKRRSTGRLQISLKLPQGPYIFCDFQTLHLPGIELNPLPSEALKRMHMLACDPGIIAIMNKHKWRVGIMTEMAPIGYVGVSPKCILGFNKNMGEEISLRLRTDDLKGFRKYESIKKTLLHELAHMVHSEHDANFFALNKQLNEEAASLDWTKSGGHVLSGRKIFDSYEDEFALEPNTSIGGRRLGGGSSSLASAHVLSGAAAYQRFLNASAREVEGAQNRVVASVKEGYVLDVEVQPDPEDAGQDFIQGKANVEPDPDDNDAMHVDVVIGASGPSDCRSFKEQDTVGYSKSDPDDAGKQSSVGFLEPDANDAISGQVRATHHGPEPADTGAHGIVVIHDAPGLGDHPTGRNMISVNMSESCNIDVMQKDTEPDPDDSSNVDNLNQVMSIDGKHHREPDPDDATCDIVLESGNKMEVETEQSSNITVLKSEPDPDDSSNIDILNQVPRIDGKHHREPNPAHANCEVVLESGTRMEVETEQSRNAIVSKSEPDPDDHAERSNSNELQRIEEPVAALCARLQKAIEMLRLQATPAEATSALQSLFKIIRNVIEHPNDIKYKRLRKSNPRFQRSVANYKAAMEVLEMIGFCEDVFLDEIGRAETYLVLKRNDPGLLWLAKSSLEVSMA